MIWHRFGPVPALALSLLAGLGAEPGSVAYRVNRPPPALHPGDVIVTDSGDGEVGGALFKLNRPSGDLIGVAVGPLLALAYDVSVTGSGQVILSAQGQIVLVDLSTGGQQVLGLREEMGHALGIGSDDKEHLFVANGRAIVELDLRHGRVRTVSEGGLLSAPVDIAVDQKGILYVVDLGQPNQIVRVHAANGRQSLVSRAGYLRGANGIALADGAIFVTCVTDPSGNFGTGRVVRVEMQTGQQRLLAEGGFLCRPVGIAASGNSLLVADPYTPNPTNAHAFDGAVIEIDLMTGQQEILARGSRSFVNPRGIAVVPETPALRKSLESPRGARSP